MDSRAHVLRKMTNSRDAGDKPLTVEEELEQISQQIPPNYFDVENTNTNMPNNAQLQQRVPLHANTREPLVAPTAANFAATRTVRAPAPPRQVPALAHPGMHPVRPNNAPAAGTLDSAPAPANNGAKVPQFDQQWLLSIPLTERQKVQTLLGMAATLSTNSRIAQTQHDEVQLRLRRLLLEKENLAKSLTIERDRQKTESKEELQLKDAELETLRQKYESLERKLRIQQQLDGTSSLSTPRTKRAKLDHYEPPNDFNTVFDTDTGAATRRDSEPVVRTNMNNKRGRISEVAETGGESVTTPVNAAVVARRRITIERGTSVCSFAIGSTSSPSTSSSTASSTTQCYLMLDDLRDGLSGVGGLTWLSRPVAHYYYQKDKFCHQLKRLPRKIIVKKLNLTRLEPAHILAEILLKLHDPVYQPEPKRTELAASLEQCYYLPSQNQRRISNFACNPPTMNIDNMSTNGKESCIRVMVPVLEEHLRNYTGFILKFGGVFNQWLYKYRATISAYQKKLPNTRKATWSQMDRGDYDVEYDEEIEARERQALKKFGASSICAAINVYRLNDHNIYDTMPEDEFNILCNSLNHHDADDNKSGQQQNAVVPTRPPLAGASVEFIVAIRQNMTATLALLNQVVEVWPDETLTVLLNGGGGADCFRLTSNDGEPLVFGSLNAAVSSDYAEHLAELVRYEFAAARGMKSLELNRPEERKFLWFRDLFTQITLPIPNLCGLKLPQLLFSIIDMAAGPIIGRGIVNGKKYLQEQFFEPHCVAQALRLVARLCELSKPLPSTTSATSTPRAVSAMPPPPGTTTTTTEQQQHHPFKLLTLEYFTRDRCERLFECKSHLVRMAFCRVVAQLLTMPSTMGSVMNLPMAHDHSAESPESLCMLSKFFKNLFVLDRADYRRPENVEIFSDLWRLIEIIAMPAQRQRALAALIGGEIVVVQQQQSGQKQHERIFSPCAMQLYAKSTQFLSKWLCYFVNFVDLPDVAEQKIALTNSIRRNRRTTQRNCSKVIKGNLNSAPVVKARRISALGGGSAEATRQNSVIPSSRDKIPAACVQRYVYKILCTYDYLLFFLLIDSTTNAAPFSNNTKKQILTTLIDPLLFLLEMMQQVKFAEIKNDSTTTAAAENRTLLADYTATNIESIYYDVIAKLIKASHLYLPEKFKLHGVWSTLLTRDCDGDEKKLLEKKLFRMQHAETKSDAEVAQQMPLLSEMKRIADEHKNMPRIELPPPLPVVPLVVALSKNRPVRKGPSMAAVVTTARLKYGRVKYVPSWAMEEAYELNPPVRRKGLNMDESLLQPLMAEFPIVPSV